MRKQTFVILTVLLAAVLSACQLGVAAPPPPAPLPTATPSLTPAPPTAVPTLTPTITPTPLLNSPNGPPLLAIQMFTQQRGWGVTENQLLATNDGGLTWAGVPVPGGQFSGYNGVFFQDANTAFVLVSMPDGKSGLLGFTSDGGHIWESIPVAAVTGRVQFMPGTNLEGFIFQDLGVLSGSMPVAVYQTLDRVHWLRTFAHDKPNEAVAGLPLVGVKNGATFITNSSGWITGSDGAANSIYLFHSTDAGRTWTKVDLTLPDGMTDFTAATLPPIFFEKSKGFLPVDFTPATGDAIRAFYYTDDSGATWTLRGTIPSGTVYDFADPNTGWSWAKGQLYFTVDGAATWSKLPVSLPSREAATCINFIDPRNGWLITRDDKARVRLYRTNDAGNTWSAVIP